MANKRSILYYAPGEVRFIGWDGGSFASAPDDPGLAPRLAGKVFRIVVEHPEVRFRTWAFPASGSRSTLRKLVYWKLKAEYGQEFEFFFDVSPSAGKAGSVEAGVLFFRNERLLRLLDELSKLSCVIDGIELVQTRLAASLVPSASSRIVSIVFDSGRDKRAVFRFEEGKLVSVGLPDKTEGEGRTYNAGPEGVLRDDNSILSALDPSLPGGDWDFLPDGLVSVRKGRFLDRAVTLGTAGLFVFSLCWLVTAGISAVVASSSFKHSSLELKKIYASDPALAVQSRKIGLFRNRIDRSPGLARLCVDWPSRVSGIATNAGPGVRFVELKYTPRGSRLELSVFLERMENGPDFVDRLKKLDFLKDVRITGSSAEAAGYSCRIEGVAR